jgi:hypothetical protein
VYKAFLGGQLAQDGLQLKWIAPTDLLIELGAELSSGSKYPGGSQNRNGAGSGALSAHVGGDIGYSTSWRAGASYLRTASGSRSFQDTNSLGDSVTDTFSGTSRLWGLDGVLKWAPNGDPTQHNFKLQGEYFQLQQNGTLAYIDAVVPKSASGYFNADQSGWYAQAVWQFYPAWRAGYRYDRLSYGTLTNAMLTSGAGLTAADFPVLGMHSPTRNSLMLDWSPTEFSRIRLQFASDNARVNATDNEVLLQYIFSLGAHGAHTF